MVPNSAAFFSSDETIQHRFIDCYVANFFWRVVQYTFDLSQPQSITKFIEKIKTFAIQNKYH